MMKRLVLLCLFALLAVVQTAYSADFNRATYYAAAEGKKGKDLKTALCGIICSHKTLSYDYLWTAYKTTDVTPEGYIWDMYSNTTKFVPGGSAQGKSYSEEGDSFNREHSLPQSWFNDRSPMKTDLYHVIPTDGYVNNRRSNYDFGEVGTISYQSNNGFSKLGKPTTELKTAGCSDGTVFEPNDMYKGDFARIYFYMVTCYENDITSWSNTTMLDKSKYPAFTAWAKQMLLKWAQNDSVSLKETDRQEGVYSIQGNRNPFVDFPGLEQYVWGTWADSTFSVTNYRNPYHATSTGDDSGDGGNDNQDDEGGDSVLNNPATGDYALVTTAPTSWSGTYLIAYHTATDTVNVKVFDGSLQSLDAANNVIDVVATDNVITSNTTVDAASFTISSTAVDGYYSIQGANGLFVGRSSAKNGLDAVATYAEALGNQLAIDDGYAVIKGTGGYQLMYNNAASSGNRFRYYKSGQQPIYLYRRMPSDEDALNDVRECVPSDAPIYDLSGRKVSVAKTKGVYIRAGRKFFVR